MRCVKGLDGKSSKIKIIFISHIQKTDEQDESVKIHYNSSWTSSHTHWQSQSAGTTGQFSSP